MPLHGVRLQCPLQTYIVCCRFCIQRNVILAILLLVFTTQWHRSHGSGGWAFWGVLHSLWLANWWLLNKFHPLLMMAVFGQRHNLCPSLSLYAIKQLALQVLHFDYPWRWQYQIQFAQACRPYSMFIHWNQPNMHHVQSKNGRKASKRKQKCLHSCIC